MADNERGQALAAYWAAVWGDDVNGEEARRAWGSHKHAFDAAWDKQQERLGAGDVTYEVVIHWKQGHYGQQPCLTASFSTESAARERVEGARKLIHSGLGWGHVLPAPGRVTRVVLREVHSRTLEEVNADATE